MWGRIRKCRNINHKMGNVQHDGGIIKSVPAKKKLSNIRLPSRTASTGNCTKGCKLLHIEIRYTS